MRWLVTLLLAWLGLESLGAVFFGNGAEAALRGAGDLHGCRIVKGGGLP